MKTAPIPITRRESDRFDGKFRRVESGCWEWEGQLDKHGYGVFAVTCADRQRPRSAHRYAYTRAKGPILEGLVIDHLCRNHKCVNPDHLEAVTVKVNNNRGEHPNQRKHRDNRCKRGHDLTRARVRKNGTRRCEECFIIDRRADYDRYLQYKRTSRRRAAERKAKAKADGTVPLVVVARIEEQIGGASV